MKIIYKDYGVEISEAEAYTLDDYHKLYIDDNGLVKQDEWYEDGKLLEISYFLDPDESESTAKQLLDPLNVNYDICTRRDHSVFKIIDRKGYVKGKLKRIDRELYHPMGWVLCCESRLIRPDGPDPIETRKYIGEYDLEEPGHWRFSYNIEGNLLYADMDPGLDQNSEHFNLDRVDEMRPYFDSDDELNYFLTAEFLPTGKYLEEMESIDWENRLEITTPPTLETDPGLTVIYKEAYFFDYYKHITEAESRRLTRYFKVYIDNKGLVKREEFYLNKRLYNLKYFLDPEESEENAQKLFAPLNIDYDICQRRNYGIFTVAECKNYRAGELCIVYRELYHPDGWAICYQPYDNETGQPNLNDTEKYAGRDKIDEPGYWRFSYLADGGLYNAEMDPYPRENSKFFFYDSIEEIRPYFSANPLNYYLTAEFFPSDDIL